MMPINKFISYSLCYKSGGDLRKGESYSASQSKSNKRDKGSLSPLAYNLFIYTLFVVQK